MKYKLPVAVFLIFIFFAGSLGMTEDEAYYWVLSQKLSLGYAYHPPGVAWAIRFFETLFLPFATKATPCVTRFPAVFITALTLALSMSWIEMLGGNKKSIEKAGLVLFSFAGMFTVSWMIVPDLPFLLGWILCFYQLSKRCFRGDHTLQGDAIIFLGMAIAVLSKYTAIFILTSGIVCSFHFLERKQFFRTSAILILGAAAGFLPNFIWNAQHHFGPLLYQLSERHSGGHFNFLRYARFWALQWVLAGALVPYFLIILKEARENKGIERFVFFWILPSALVFWIQPAFSDFKFHWTLISWFPAALLLAYKFSNGQNLKFAKTQMAIGMSLMALVLICFQLPIVSMVAEALGKPLDPKYDITNDVYGWSDLKVSDQGLPWVGSRYQTASLAAYSLKDASRVELIPRDEKSFDEWPQLSLTSSSGPEWPRIEKPFIFVADNRFSGQPEFKSGDCSSKKEYRFYRWRYLAKTITLYDCRPH